MDASAPESLGTQLGDRLAVCLGDLDDHERRDLAAAIADARARQAIEVDAAVDGALKRLPRGLRGAVRVILLG